MTRTPSRASVSTASAMRGRSLLRRRRSEVLDQPVDVGVGPAQHLAHDADEDLELLLAEVLVEVRVDRRDVDGQRALERLAALVGQMRVGRAAIVGGDLAP